MPANPFEWIYATDLWRGGSGPGSSPEHTLEYRRFLQSFLVEHDIRSVLDVGCGDWQFSHLLDWEGIHYIGVDLSRQALARARERAPATASFIHGDLRELPTQRAELAIVKDVLQHLSWKSIREVLDSLGSCERILVVNDAPQDHRDITDGNWRPIDIREEPISREAELVFQFQSHPFEKLVLLIDQCPST